MAPSTAISRSQAADVSTCTWASGKLTVNGEALAAGDALKLTDSAGLVLSNGADAEVLDFDLPG